MVSSKRFGFKTVPGIRWPCANTTAFTYSQAVQGISALACCLRSTASFLLTLQSVYTQAIGCLLEFSSLRRAPCARRPRIMKSCWFERKHVAVLRKKHEKSCIQIRLLWKWRLPSCKLLETFKTYLTLLKNNWQTIHDLKLWKCWSHFTWQQKH